MLIKPAQGLKVRDPIKHDDLPEKGREVKDNDLYWLRRLQAGDVVRVEQKTETKTSTKTSNKGSK